MITSENTVSLGTNNTLGISEFNHDSELYLRSEVEIDGKKYNITEVSDSALSNLEFEKVILPKTINKIGAKAFYKSNITELDLSATNITEVPSFCFSYSRIKKLSLPQTIQTISESSFSMITLVNFVFPKALVSIGSRSFESSVIDVIDLSQTSVNHISSYAFIGSTLKTFISSPLLQKIEQYAFANTPIQSLSFSTTLSELGDHCFYNCKALESIDLSPTIIQIIPGFCFYKCRKLAKCLFPLTVSILHNFAFSQSGITKINFPPKLSEIPRCCFLECLNLEEIDLSHTIVKNIGSVAFANCKFLSSVNFGNNLEMIEEVAFSNTSLRSIVLPHTTDYIGLGAFAYCDELLSVDFSKAKIKGIEKQTFYKSSKLKEIKIPKSVTFIGDAAFYMSDLRKIKFDSNISSLGKTSFYGCPNLNSVDLSRCPLRKIHDFTFANCQILSEVILPSLVRSIGLSVFMGTKISSFDGGRTLQTVGPKCFMNSKLKKVDLSRTAITVLPSQIFFNCSELNDVKLPLVLEFISPSSFTSTVLTNLVFPRTLKTVGPHSFFDCQKIEILNFTNTVLYEIGHHSFYKCKSLKTLLLPDTVKYIGGTCFGHTNLTELAIPENENFVSVEGDVFNHFGTVVKLDIEYLDIAEIQSFLFFKDLSKLEYLSLPKKLESVSDTIFVSCPKLKFIYYGGTNKIDTVQQIDGDAPVIFVSKDYPDKELFGIHARVIKDSSVMFSK